MGDAVDEILNLMDLSDENKKKYELVKSKFNEHFARDKYRLAYKWKKSQGGKKQGTHSQFSAAVTPKHSQLHQALL